MRTKMAFYNLAVSIALQLVTMIVGFLIPPIRIRVYGSATNGLLASIGQMLGYFRLVEGGIGTAAIQALFNPLSKKDYSEINSILAATQNFYYRVGMIFSILVTIFALIFPFLIKEDLSKPLVFGLVIVMAGGIIAEYFLFSKYRILLTADQKGYIVIFWQIITMVFYTIITIMLMLSKKSILEVQVYATIINLLRIVPIIIYFKKSYPEVHFNALPNFKAIGQRWEAFVHQINGLIILNSSTLILTFFVGLEEVSVYSVYNIIFISIGSFLGAFSNGLLSGFGQVIASDQREVFQKIYSNFECLFYLVMGWAYASAFILTIPFLKLYTKGIHDANYIDPMLAILFVLVGVLNNIRMPQNMIIFAAGHFKETRWRAVIEVVINLVASLVFVHFFNIYGVLLGSICSFAYRTVESILYGNHYILRQSPKRTFFRIILNILLGSIAVISFDLFVTINATNWTSLLFESIVIAAIIFLIMIIGNFVFEKRAMLDIVERIRLILRRFTQK